MALPYTKLHLDFHCLQCKQTVNELLYVGVVSIKAMHIPSVSSHQQCTPQWERDVTGWFLMTHTWLWTILTWACVG